MAQGKATHRLASGIRDGFLFAAGAVDANDGCTDYVAPANYDTASITIGQVSRSAPICTPDPVVRQGIETLMNGMISVARDGTSLTLTGNGVRLTLHQDQNETYPPGINTEPANPSMTVPPPPRSSSAP